MSKDTLVAFLQKVSQDTQLKQRIEQAADLEEATAVAFAAGFEISSADWSEYISTNETELSDEDLEQVSGGTAQVIGCLFGTSLVSDDCRWANN
jgi:predicted ribosomally synthesized peptide with nif11-like leader